MMARPRLLIVSDFAAHTGFSRVAESIAKELRGAWDIAVLAMNYLGYPHPLQQHYRLYSAIIGGDPYGVESIARIADFEHPAVILFITDPWGVRPYLDALRAGGHDATPTVAYCPVDGPCLRRVDVAPLARLTHLISYTDFGARAFAEAGYARPVSVIPHGIDLAAFQPPADRAASRERNGIAPEWFVVGIIDRNQPRKCLDIAFDGFAQFAEHVPTARLLYHGSLLDIGWDIEDMAISCGIDGRLILTGRDFTARQGVSTAQLAGIYGLCDVRLSTTAGEGWGLTVMEAMACGVPCIVPEWSALGEWAAGAVHYLPIDHTRRHAGRMNTRGGIVAPSEVARALTIEMEDAAHRAELSAAGLALVAEPRYRWAHIAARFDAVLSLAVEGLPDDSTIAFDTGAPRRAWQYDAQRPAGA